MVPRERAPSGASPDVVVVSVRRAAAREGDVSARRIAGGRGASRDEADEDAAGDDEPRGRAGEDEDEDACSRPLLASMGATDVQPATRERRI